MDNDDYAGGTSFCNSCRAGAKTNARLGNNENAELLQYYYHPDHLGSSSFITDLDGNIAQHVEYVPFGEVFLEEHNNTWQTPYLFNGKELDEETGLYYYGARYYEPKVSQWLSVDAPLLSGKYLEGIHNDGGVYNSFNLGSYLYCRANPIVYSDPDGNQTNKTEPKQAGAFPLPSTPPTPTVPMTVIRGGGAAAEGAGVLETLVIGGLRLLGTIGLLLIPMQMGTNDIPIKQPISLPKPQLAPKPKKEKKDEVYTLYKTTRSQKTGKSLPYYGIIKNAVVASPGVNGRYSATSEEGSNAQVLATGNYQEIAGAESQLIKLNSGGSIDDATVRAVTTIDNFRVTHKDPIKLNAGERLLDLKLPNWRTTQLQPQKK